jgi:hypothetical protein
MIKVLYINADTTGMTEMPETMPARTESSAPIRFFWTQREDGAEVFCCCHSDGSATEVLSPNEIATAEELIAELATIQCNPNTPNA